MNRRTVEDLTLIVAYLTGRVTTHDNGLRKERKDQLGYNYEEYERGTRIPLSVDRP